MPSEKTLAFAARARAMRRLLGLHQEEVADAAGISQALVSQIELGRYSPNSALRQRIAAVLSMPAEKSDEAVGN